MSSRSDPVENAAEDDRDLYDVATWEERTSLDGLAVALHWLFVRSAKALVVGVAFLILLSIFATIGFGIVFDPFVATLTGLSVLPALALFAYVYVTDVSSEPLSLLVATFLLAILTATFAAIVNMLLEPYFAVLGVLGLPLFFFLVVGPVEETVKLLAVRLYAYTDERFDAVIDGAVYGAVAGLGFATIENLIYITGEIDVGELVFGTAVLAAGDGIAAVRALAGPGHVIYSAYAGYYLGLAKFNPGNRGPIVVKGLLIAAVIHAAYNTLVVPVSAVIIAVTGVPDFFAFLTFVIAFQGLFAYLLFRKIWRYRDTYRDVYTDLDGDVEPELTEFEE